MLLPRCRLAILVLMGAVAPALGCGSQSATADLGWTHDPGRTQGERREASELHPTPLATSAAPVTLVGVRHDLMLAPAPSREPRCSCLAVEVGAASDPKFQWLAGPARVGPDATVLAISGRGVPCPGGEADEDERRPSISAVDVVDSDVIVEIEELPAGLPLANGAVIPKPGPGGSIYVRGRSPTLAYARPVAGARCKVF